MTQEEKAKAYDYAVAYAKSELDCMDEDYRCVNITKDDVISMYAKLFPELREDKDVKLNRKLIYGLRSLMRLGNNTFAGADIEDCIDYLERLKAEESVLSEINVEYGDNVDFSNEAISFIYGGDGLSLIHI